LYRSECWFIGVNVDCIRVNSDCIGVNADLGKICVFSQRYLLAVQVFGTLLLIKSLSQQTSQVTRYKFETACKRRLSCLFTVHSLIDYSIHLFSCLESKNVGEEK
jgi:hypothetical protein